jgi:ATP-dependent DNA helicase RecG
MDEIVGTVAETLVAQVLGRSESSRFETKRVSGKMVSKTLETICTFANTQSGTLVGWQRGRHRSTSGQIGHEKA